MPKMKTHSGAKHRFFMTGTGKYLRSKGSRRHLKMHKSRRVRSLDEKKFPVAPTHTRKLRVVLLPYGVP